MRGSLLESRCIFHSGADVTSLDTNHIERLAFRKCRREILLLPIVCTVARVLPLGHAAWPEFEPFVSEQLINVVQTGPTDDAARAIKVLMQLADAASMDIGIRWELLQRCEVTMSDRTKLNLQPLSSPNPLACTT